MPTKSSESEPNLRCNRSKVKKIPHSCGIGLGIVLLALGAVGGCAGQSPSARFDTLAKQAGMRSGELAGAGFQHRTFAAPPTADPTAADGGQLRVYFDGDGTPFVRRDLIARDPTPREALTLRLMRQDPHRSVFLGRPCYHGLVDGCEPGLWTVGRYSEPIVASMTAATRHLIAERAYTSVVLIGYSGGGVLAVLVAERLEQVDAVVTVAANLDLAAWTQLHGYSPLVTSLDPARIAGSRRDLPQLHLAGAADANVPPTVHQALIERLPAATFRTVPGFDHRCCWADAWPRLLAEIDVWLATALSGNH